MTLPVGSTAITDPNNPTHQLAINADGSINTTGGGAGGTQYTDGAAAPSHPVGTELVFNNAGTMTAITNAIGLPIAALPAGTNNIGSSQIADGIVTSQKATVSAFHSSDNQNPGGTAYALFTGGVAQIYNPAGTLDRQRGTGSDAIPAVGVATGTQQLAGPALTTTFNGALTGSATVQTVTVASTASMKVGDILTTSDNSESTEVVTIPSGTTFTATLKNNHANLATLTWWHYNQARDASIGDQVALTGMSPSQTYLYNNITQLAEIERSAAGELDGGKGTGFNAAIGQEYNGGGPALSTGLLSAYNYDRERNVQAKSLQTATLTATAATDTVLKFASATATNTVQPGAPVLLAAGSVSVLANQKEIVYVSASWVPGSAANVPIQSPVVNSGSTTAAWEIYATNGPGLSGFTAVGVGIEEEALYDPVSGLYYIERAATADTVAPQNVVLESVGLWNGTTFDRLRTAGNLGDSYTTGFIGAAQMVFNGGSFDRLRTPGKFVTIAALAITAGTPVAAWTPAAGKKFHMMGFAVSLSVAGSVIFKDGSGTEILRTPLMAAGVGLVNPANFGNGYPGTTASQAMYLDATASGSVSGFVFGTEEF